MPTMDDETDLSDCGWIKPFILTAHNPGHHIDWVSGVYLAKLTATDSETRAILFGADRQLAQEQEKGSEGQTYLTNFSSWTRDVWCEQGTHMQLLDRLGLYANLYKQQSPRQLCDQDVVTGLPLPSTSETEMKPHA